MKNLLWIFLGLSVIPMGCEPDYPEPYTIFTIEKGSHDSGWPPELLHSSILKFEAIFDESAIYTSLTVENQWDTNKLMGFSDCNSFHHENSARFGWRWLNDQLEIIAYCYVSGQVIIEPIGPVALNEPSSYQLQLLPDIYRFTLNGKVLDIKREAPCQTGAYYKLWPYFGGDEVAPHTIQIKIKTLY